MKAVADITGAQVDTVAQMGDIVAQATPEQMERVGHANNAFRIRMRELDNELVAAELADTQNARSEHKHSSMPAVICVVLTALIAATGWLLFTHEVPPPNEQIANILFGALVAKWGDSIAYWVGTTRSSAIKSFNNSSR
jgi:serine/threonine protein phosphatase PrpC